MVAETLRLAVWSGPRNISTALMRAWGNRGDTTVVDEPLYGYYLHHTGIDHPMREAIMASMPVDWRPVRDALIGPAPAGAAIWYQKHMTHHLVGDIDLDWIDRLTNVLLIRDPRAVIASYHVKRDRVTLADLGIVQQADLARRLIDRGHRPLVIDGAAVLRDPAGQLARWCAAIGVRFDRAMLSWPAGRRPSDGVWADHWYGVVERSTGFLPYRERPIELPPALDALADRARASYDWLRTYAVDA